MRNNKPRSTGSKKRKNDDFNYQQEVSDSFNDLVSKKRIIKMKNIKLTEKQQHLLSLIEKNKISVISGPPGTSKSFSGCYAAIKLLMEGKIEKIYLTTPIVEVGNSLGFLKGDLNSKIEVYLERFISNFSEIIDSKLLGSLMNDKIIEFKPVQFMRGSTFKNCVFLVDEFENFDSHELMTVITRIKDGKIIFMGDKKQSDIRKQYLATDFLKELLQDIPQCCLFEFERADIMRDPILIQITDKYEQMEKEGKLPKNKNNN